MFSRKTMWALVASVLCATAGIASAQDPRGTLTGTVTDSTGAVLPGVTVVVKNTETGIAQQVVTDSDGRYQVLYVNPGTYAVTAELTGFKRFVNTATRVGVSDLVRLDVVLQAGGLEETVTVSAETPLMNTSAVSGTTVDARQIAELPLGDGTAYMLTRLAPGIMDTSDLHFSRPADNGNLAGIVANGAQGGNEFKIDGAPNMSNARGVGFSPPSGAISEFKVETNAFDAQTGHTAGAVVNLALKSGTNALRGEAGYFNRDDSRSSTPLLTERENGDKPTREYNRYTGTVGGPLVRNRTFYMASFERLKDIQPEPASYTVPTLKMREGDFSEFTTQIFNPFTATGSTRARTPFPNNRIPNDMIDPVARAYAALYPAPNRTGTEDNYFTNQLRPYDYNAFMGRVDHNFSSNNRMYATGYWNKRQEDRFNWAQEENGGIINGVAVTHGFDYRSNLGVSTGYTSVISPSLLLDIRASGARFDEYRDPAEEFDPASLGFSPAAVQLMNGYQYLPLFTFGSFSTTNSGSTIASLGSQRSDWNQGFARPMDTFSVQPTVTKLWKGHTARGGYEYRYQKWNITNAGYPGGRFHFNDFFTRASNSINVNNNVPQVWAAFLLGLPTVGTNTVANPGATASQFEIASPASYTQATHGLFVQDDWQVNNRLTLNGGLRLEINGGQREAQNRLVGPFDFDTPSPIEAAARAAYAANPIPELPLSEFNVTGGLTYVDGPMSEAIIKLLPRLAGAYVIDSKTVFRGGVGLFSYDYFFDNLNQAGFSQATPVSVSNDNGLTFTSARLHDPLPGGQLSQPVGASLGLSSQLGQSPGTLFPREREAPYYTRWEASLQRDFGQGWIVSLTYLGSRGRNLPVVQAINGIPLQFLSRGRSADPATQPFLSATFPNPFAGLLPGSTLNNATISRANLLRPYPHFGSTFSVERYDGSDRYNAGTIQLQKRFSNGNSISTQYTRSSLRDKLNYLNPIDGQLEDRVSPNDRPDRFSIGTVLRLPFGSGEKWGRGWGTLTNGLLGGWQLSSTYQYQSGAPLTWGNVYFSERCGNPLDLKSNIGKRVNGGIAGLDVPAWDISCFYFPDATVRNDPRINLGNNVRYFPSTLPHVRTDDIHLLDVGVSKNFALPRGTRLQFRLEAINALNYTVLWAPTVNPTSENFGKITTDRNSPRDFQIGLRFTF